MLHRVLSPFAETAYALLRIVAGALFAFHGMQKLFGILGADQPPAGSLMWVGGVIELVCGVAIALGLFTSFAAFLASGEMAVAYVKFHWKGRLDAGFFPASNGGELALVYALLFLYVACRGAGRFSVGRRMHASSAARA